MLNSRDRHYWAQGYRLGLASGFFGGALVAAAVHTLAALLWPGMLK